MPQTPETTQTAPIVFVEADLSDAPEWIPLLPTPQVYQHAAYGEVDLSPDTVAEYVANFKAGLYGQVLPVDLEHDLPLSGAMADITDLRTNDDGTVDAKVTWNSRGRQVIGEKRFRYVSPTLRTNWTDPVTLQQHKHVIVGAALTTRPYFKSQSLRPLIAASEPVDTQQRGPAPMTDAEMQAQKDAATAEGAAIVEKQFGEKIADMEVQLNEAKAQVQTFAERLTAAETENAALKSAAEEREFREQLKGVPPTEIDHHIAKLRALPVELREAEIKVIQNAVSVNRSRINFSEKGVDAHGEATAKAKLNARADELRKADPKLTQAQAFSEACRTESDLYREYRAETQA